MNLLKLFRKLITSCCLKPTYSLRRQLVESYGTTAFLSIGSVVIFGILVVIHSGYLVKENARYGLTLQVTTKLHTLNKHAAFVLTEKLSYYRGTSTLLSEFVRDRIVGYNGSIDIPKWYMNVIDKSVIIASIDTSIITYYTITY